MSHEIGAFAFAEAQVAGVRDDPESRLALMARLFRGPTGRAPRHVLFRLAALSFMRWQAQRGVLNPLDASPPGSVRAATRMAQAEHAVRSPGTRTPYTRSLSSAT